MLELREALPRDRVLVGLRLHVDVRLAREAGADVLRVALQRRTVQLLMSTNFRSVARAVASLFALSLAFACSTSPPDAPDVPIDAVPPDSDDAAAPVDAATRSDGRATDAGAGACRSLPSGTCNDCLKTSCCASALACDGDAACAACLEDPSGAGCATNAKAQRVKSCVSGACATACPTWVDPPPSPCPSGTACDPATYGSLESDSSGTGLHERLRRHDVRLG